jgi:hypothetical protein
MATPLRRLARQPGWQIRPSHQSTDRRPAVGQAEQRPRQRQRRGDIGDRPRRQGIRHRGQPRDQCGPGLRHDRLQRLTESRATAAATPRLIRKDRPLSLQWLQQRHSMLGGSFRLSRLAWSVRRAYLSTCTQGSQSEGCDTACMSAHDIQRSGWPSWVHVLAGITALSVTFVLGTIGWLFASFGIGTSCDEALECTISCAPCAAAHAWILADGIGQWVLFATAATILVLGPRRPDLRGTTTLAAGALVVLAVGWFVASMAIATQVQPKPPPQGSSPAISAVTVHSSPGQGAALRRSLWDEWPLSKPGARPVVERRSRTAQVRDLPAVPGYRGSRRPSSEVEI